MTAIDLITIAIGLFLLTFIWLMLADKSDVRRVAGCVRSIVVTRCPKCNQVIGEDAAMVTTRMMIKITKTGVWRQCGHDHPSRLVAVVCPHCAAELEFRIDGRLFSAGHVAATWRGRPDEQT